MATPCFALFGEDIAYLIQLINQGRQTIQLANQAKAQFEQAAAFVKNPGGWKSILYRGEAALDEISSQPPSLANMAALSALSLQQVEAKNQADQLAESLQINDELRIARQHESWGCISCTMQRGKQ